MFDCTWNSIRLEVVSLQPWRWVHLVSQVTTRRREAAALSHLPTNLAPKPTKTQTPPTASVGSPQFLCQPIFAGTSVNRQSTRNQVTHSVSLPPDLASAGAPTRTLQRLFTSSLIRFCRRLRIWPRGFTTVAVAAIRVTSLPTTTSTLVGRVERQTQTHMRRLILSRVETSVSAVPITIITHPVLLLPPRSLSHQPAALR